MSRRDIIIIAVLVNAGLLAILFMMAVTSENESVNEAPALVSIVEEKKPLTEISRPSSMMTSRTPTDEVDQAIQALTDPSTPQPLLIEDDCFDLDQDSEEEEIEQPKVQQEQSTSSQEEPEMPKKQQPPVMPKSPSTDGRKVEVTVKKGDSLDKIARANGTTIKAIKEANQLKNDRLKVGQILQVPISNEKKVVSKEKPAPKKETEVANIDSQYYTIKSGDNPWKIAKKFNIKVDDFLKLNQMSEEKARNMKVGDKVRVK